MMKKSILPFLIASGMLASAPVSFAAPAILVQDGNPRFTIVTDTEPNKATTDAVRELNYWVKRITGTSLPVKTVEQWTGNAPYIAVGASQLTTQNGWDKEPFEQEEARVFIEENRIGLLGNDDAPYPNVTWEGTYYAALELIQKEFGARWVWPGKSGEIFEERTTLSVPEKSWNWAPSITAVRKLRNSYGSGVIPTNLKENYGIDPNENGSWQRMKNDTNQWLKRERMNQSSNIRFGHAFTSWWDKYSDKHPDWFAKPPEGFTQRGGKGVKLNISHPEVHDQIIKDWEVKWKEAPLANKFLNVSPNDSRGYDTRPETRAWDPPQLQQFTDKQIYNSDEAVLTDRYVKLWNLLAKRVREIDPEAQVATYAYRNYQKPPLEEKHVESNVVVGYVGGEGFYPDEREIVDEWKKWSDTGAQLFWRPNLFHAGHGIPYNYAKALFNDFRFFQKHGLVGFDFDSLVGNWGTQGLAYYVLAEASSRLDASYEELANEYFAAFGAAAPYVQKYFEHFEDVTQKAPQLIRDHRLSTHNTWGSWRRAHIRLVPLFLTPEVVEPAEKILAQAEKSLPVGPSIHRDRLASVQTSFEHAKLMAETFRKLQIGNPKASVRYDDKQEILQPLWDYRQNILADLSVPAARLISGEQGSLSLWNGFDLSNTKKTALIKSGKLIDLISNWQFLPDPAEGQNVQSPDFDDSSWKKIHADNWWQRAGYPDYWGVAWYRKSFEAPKIQENEKAILQFEGIDGNAEVFLNGRSLGKHTLGEGHKGWDEPFSFDISAKLDEGKNLIAVKVQSKSSDTASGINQPVQIVIASQDGEIYPLRDGWKFRIDPDNQGRAQKWFASTSFDDWKNVAVSKPWRDALSGVPDGKIGWYQLNFEVPNLKDTGEKVLLQFDSVDAETFMWVNGVKVDERGYPHDGNYESWDEPFEVDITNAIKESSKNNLVIRVESERQGNAGITGDVKMVIKE